MTPLNACAINFISFKMEVNGFLDALGSQIYLGGLELTFPLSQQQKGFY